MVTEMHTALMELKDKPPKILLLTGAGTSFCSGHDLSTPPSFSDAISIQTFLQKMQEITTTLVRFPAPVITAIQGYALGAGLEIAMNSDLIYAANDAVLRFPELEVGLSITQGSSYFLPRKVSLQKAKELLYFGEEINAKEAKELGFINEFFPTDTLLKEVHQFIEKLNEKPVHALSSVKNLLNRGAETTL